MPRLCVICTLFSWLVHTHRTAGQWCLTLETIHICTVAFGFEETYDEVMLFLRLSFNIISFMSRAPVI